MLEYLALIDTLEGIEASMNVLTILFAPEQPVLSLAEYHRQAWNVMQNWIDHDPQGWPTNIPKNPDHPLWSLCFRGVPILRSTSTARPMSSTAAEILRPSLALITQPRDGLDHVAGPSPHGDAVRKKIRRQMHSYDGQAAPDDLGTYSHASNREWWRSVILEENTPRVDPCPLRIH